MEARVPGWCLGLEQPDRQKGLLHAFSDAAASEPLFASLGQALAFWAWTSRPLERDMCVLLAHYHQQFPFLSRESERIVVESFARLNRLTVPEETAAAWQELAAEGDRSLILRFLAAKLTNSDTGMPWLALVWRDLLLTGKPELGRVALDTFSWPDSLLPLKIRLEAEWAFHYLPPEEAIDFVRKVDPAIWNGWRAYLEAELLLRAGEREQGASLLAALWQCMHWHPNLTLKLAELAEPAPVAGPIRREQAAILVYSWNKADLLADTLESLAQGDLGEARIFALDNGSDDHTPTVLATARDRFGMDRFHVETLPVNVGAPAARNWLLALPQVQECQWAAFLDDDVVLPEDWLRRLLGAASLHASAGAVGCRITSARTPYGLQSGDYNLFPTPPQEPAPGELPNRVQVHDNCAGGLDNGLFTYARPCLSVSGCCHLVNMEAVRRAGAFDLRYTPSQFDDLDRDIRSNLASMPSVYAGGLAVRHVQHSSLAKARTVKQIGHVMGNKFKLDTRYSDEELVRLARENSSMLAAHLDRSHGLAQEFARSLDNSDIRS